MQNLCSITRIIQFRGADQRIYHFSLILRTQNTILSLISEPDMPE